MLTQIQIWRNSQGLRLPKTILEAADLRVNDDVNVTIVGVKIIIEAAEKIHGRFDILELVSAMPTDYQTAEVDWGEPAGQEVW